MGDRRRRHARQDDDDLADRRAARSRRPRSDRDQWRHHQRLRYQCAARHRRLDGGRSRRKRRYVRQAAVDHRRGHNIDPEHLDHYGSVEALHQGFESFVAAIPFYGVAVLCIDHPVVQGLIPKLSERRVVTYGFNPQADVRADAIALGANGAHFDAIVTDRRDGTGRTIPRLHLPMFGRHNVQNALAAVAVASELKLADDVVRKAFAGFKGVKRRFTKTGEWNGVTIIDDYAHHPVEIAAVLKAARGATQHSVIAVVQPHRYTRVKHLFEEFCTCFNDADVVLVADIYPAGEAPIPGIDRGALVAGLKAHGHRNALRSEERRVGKERRSRWS